MLPPYVVAGTAMAASSGRSFPVVTPATGVSESSSAASSRPRAAVAAIASAASFVIPVGPAGQRDARPLHPQRAGVGGAVGRIVQSGDDVVEQVLNVQAHAIQVPLRR